VPLRLLIDSDNALGSPRGDVDDALALAALLRSGLPVVALSSVGGNTSEARADRNNRRLGDLCGYPGLYFRGAEAGEVEDRVDRAVELWAGDPVRVLALGPLTNVAAALRELARVGRRPAVSEVVLVGANASSPGRFPPWWPHEFNLTHDREATRAVFASDLSLTIVPLDVARRLRVGKERFSELHGELGEALRRGSARWLRRSRLLRWSSSFPAFDLLAALYAIDPSLVSTEETTARVHSNLWIEFGQGGRPVRLVRDFDDAGCWRRFVELVNSQGSPGSPRQAPSLRP
jgi:inosine-uridine nucleoside N-ribohydrolase